MYWEFSTKFVGTIISTSTELAHTKYRKPESLWYGFSLSHGFIVSCKVCRLSWAPGTQLWISSCVFLGFIIIFFKLRSYGYIPYCCGLHQNKNKVYNFLRLQIQTASRLSPAQLHKIATEYVFLNISLYIRLVFYSHKAM